MKISKTINNRATQKNKKQMTRNTLHSSLTAAWQQSCSWCIAAFQHTSVLLVTVVVTFFLALACEREPKLHLHEGGPIKIVFPFVNLDLEAYWDYERVYGTKYDWKSEWYYGWDDKDAELYGTIGYTEPKAFQLRGYYTKDDPTAPHTQKRDESFTGNSHLLKVDWGFWDFLVWNDVVTLDGVQNLNFDETSSLEYVTAYTNQTMSPSRYQAPRYTRSFWEPEALFAAYQEDVDINRDLEGFTYDPEENIWIKNLKMYLYPITYIYLPQIILHHNNNKIVNVDGSGNLSGMARTVNLNTGIPGTDAITVNYNLRFKPKCDMNGETVDIIGGRFLTFGLCGLNPRNITQKVEIKDDLRHYMDVNMQFNNGLDSTFVFDLTDQVRKLYKGGVLTIELDMDTIPIPFRSGGSAFDAVVKDFEDGGTHEFEM